MKQFIKVITAIIALLSSGMAVGAIITSPLSQTITPTSPFLVSSTTSFEHTFDFTGANGGYVAGSDNIGRAWLSVLLNDDGGAESYKFLLNSTMFLADINTPHSELYDKLSITGTPLSSLSADGKLKLTVSASSGSFKLVSSTLDVEMTHTVPDTPVPEPVSIALFGLGLAGMLAVRSKARR